VHHITAYLNSFDYSDVYRPELFLKGMVKNSKDLRRIRLKTVRSHVQVNWDAPTESDFGDLYSDVISDLQKVEDKLWNRKIPAMVQAYFEDMKCVLQQLSCCATPDAQVWLVVSTSAYGDVEIPVDLILANIGTQNGLRFVLPSIMYRERKFEFQIAARKRAAGDQLRSACSLAAKHQPQSSTFFVAFTPRTLCKPGYGLPFMLQRSRVTSHRILIETPRLEFPATPTKQTLRPTSNRDKITLFFSRLAVPPRNHRDTSPPEFLIANLELEFFLNIAKSMKYKSLIANKRRFSVRCDGSRFRAPESLFGCRNLSSENRSTTLAGRLKLKIGAIRTTLVKVKSLLCYGDSHFQLCKMVTNSPSVILGEN
jgi:hypothetical protein